MCAASGLGADARGPGVGGGGERGPGGSHRDPSTPSGIRLGRLRPRDARRCAELERQLFPGDDPWPEQVFREACRAPGALYLGAYAPRGVDPSGPLRGAGPVPGRPRGADPEAFPAPDPAGTVARGGIFRGPLVGYAGLQALGTPEDPEYEVHTIGVDPAWRRRGVGGALMGALLEAVAACPGPVFLEVRTDNEGALAMYRRRGFEVIGLRRNYYQPSGADAYTMRRLG